ncbi:Putative cytochrome P450 CYP13A10 [Rhizoctonia solani AG-1 IB]|uniref:Putative cytochrome P450 CYP13A10 n=1 Tax=Thanatephorus cucumeris (strain AG1-IB / isolate 7/3/14) TaxID=1108050 RepID=M5C2A0_THACB|nr:Putative cytochrome P450 CYP13A10 [Rhizoctonia solani AG-1 IB]
MPLPSSAFPVSGGNLIHEILAILELIKQNPINYALVATGLAGAYLLYNMVQRARLLRSLQGPASPSFLSGHLSQFFDPATGHDFYVMLRSRYGRVCRLKGALGEDQLWISDPRALQDIAMKESNNFLISRELTAFVEMIIGSTIITLENAILSDTNGEDGKGTVDVFKWINMVSVEMIGQAGLGHTFEVMDGKGEYLIYALGRWVIILSELWWARPFLPQLRKIGSGLFGRFVIERIPLSSVQELIKISDTLTNMAADMYKRKKDAIANGTSHTQVGAGSDIMTLLLKQNEILPPNQRMPEEEVVSQIFGLVFAGSDGTSSAITTTLNLLVQHPEIQDKLRAEVQEAYHQYGQDLDYDQLSSLTLLDAICRESLRLFPAQPVAERTAMKDWTLTLHQPVKSSDGKTMITHVPVKKGTQIYIGIDAANRDKQIWGDDADEFKPSRWLGDLPASVKDSKMPSAYSSIMTFWGGPKACIGIKFAPLQMKLVLSRLIYKFKFENGRETISFNIEGVYKPYVVREDGTRETSASMPLKVTLVGSSE